MTWRWLVPCAVALFAGPPLAPGAGGGEAASVEELERSFREPPDDTRILMRWWWFGPAVTTPQLEREMRAMQAAGIGGFEIQPVYPVALDDEASGIRNLPFLSRDFLEAVRFVADKARDLGLRVDLTLGSGWPYGGPQVPITGAAGRLRVERVTPAAGAVRVPVPDIGPGERLLAAFLAPGAGDSIASDGLRELPEPREGAIALPGGLHGSHQVLFFIASRTGMMVKRPAVGAEGYVLDHYDRGALEGYLRDVGEPLLKAFGDRPPFAVFCDSLEVFGSDWTADFLEQFRSRRGYELKPLLPALAVDVGPHAAAIRHDWGRTLTELLDQRFLVPLREWAERHGTRLRIQGYGIPPATIASNAHAHLPEGEGYQWKTLRASRWAASASHVFGRPVTSSETWTWLHSPSFRATPLDLKAEADLHFLQGVNQLIGHGWPYTAPGVDYPGWRFYAAGAFNDSNPWWIAMPDVSLYLQRVSHLLRQGAPANDVALYLPNADAWSGYVAGRVHYLIEALRDRVGPNAIGQVLEAGFNLDFFDDDVLARVGRVEGGTLALGPNRYRAVVLPNVEHVPPATLRTLAAFVDGGGVLIATRRIPARAPGFRAGEQEQAEVKALAARLFAGPLTPAHLVEDEAGLGARLARSLTPDLRLSPAAPEIGFVHRRLPFADVYFVANTSNLRRRAAATFRVDGSQAESWDALTGRVSSVASRRVPGGLTLDLDIEPYGSRAFVFLKRRRTPPAMAMTNAGSAIDLSSDWRVRFGDAPPRPLEALGSWTDDESTRHFSGVAAYERDVTLPAGWTRPGLGLRLTFGEASPVVNTNPRARMQAWLDAPVREAAVVHVNGRRAGSVWCPPYALDVTGFFREGPNALRIEVGNLAINHMAGRALPDYRLLNLRYGVRFEPQDMKDLEPLPSGLLQAVRLAPVGFEP